MLLKEQSKREHAYGWCSMKYKKMTTLAVTQEFNKNLAMLKIAFQNCLPFLQVLFLLQCAVTEKSWMIGLDHTFFPSGNYHSHWLNVSFTSETDYRKAPKCIHKKEKPINILHSLKYMYKKYGIKSSLIWQAVGIKQMVSSLFSLFVK